MKRGANNPGCRVKCMARGAGKSQTVYRTQREAASVSRLYLLLAIEVKKGAKFARREKQSRARIKKKAGGKGKTRQAERQKGRRFSTPPRAGACACARPGAHVPPPAG